MTWDETITVIDTALQHTQAQEAAIIARDSHRVWEATQAFQSIWGSIQAIRIDGWSEIQQAQLVERLKQWHRQLEIVWTLLQWRQLRPSDAFWDPEFPVAALRLM